MIVLLATMLMSVHHLTIITMKILLVPILLGHLNANTRMDSIVMGKIVSMSMSVKSAMHVILRLPHV